MKPTDLAALGDLIPFLDARGLTAGSGIVRSAIVEIEGLRALQRIPPTHTVVENETLAEYVTAAVELALSNAEVDRLRGVLQSIADEDYRGYRPTSSVRAYEALQTDLRRS